MSSRLLKVLAGSGSKDPYEIEQSVLLDDGDGATLYRTPSSAGNRKTWTYSCWFKRSRVGITSGSDSYFYLFSCGIYGGNETSIRLQADSLQAFGYDGGSSDWSYYSNTKFRDVSAWYHLVVACDTTDSTEADRVKIYINGERVTDWSSPNHASLNFDTMINNTNFTSIGGFVNSSSNGGIYRWNGYVAEAYLIDGTALPVSSFGQTDSTTGQWIPKKYTGGSYGTNGFYLPFTKNDRYSVYFDDTSSTGISIADSSDWDFGTNNFTVECWIYRNEDAGDQSYIFGQADYTNGANAGNSVYISVYDQHLSGVAVDASNTNNYVFLYSTADSTTVEDNKWYHVAMVRNGNDWALYLDGTAVDTETSSITVNSCSSVFGVGKQGVYNDGFWKGWISNFRLVMGTAVYTSNFTPPTSPLTAITNTKLLCCQDADPTVDNSGTSKTLTVTAANTYTQQMAPFTYDWYQDHSGQDNHYQADNLTVNDIMLDSPTNNYCTLNSVASGDIFSQGTLKCTTGSNTNRIAVGTMSTPSSGKWYWECTPTNLTGGCGIGVGNLGSYQTSVNSYIGNYAGTYLWYSYSGNGYKDVNGSNSSVAQSFAANDVVGVALDLDAGTLTMYKNGSSQLQVASGLSGQFEPVFGDGSGSNSATFTVNFGQKDFAHTPPSGFKALNTVNMPDPTIKKPTDHFNTVLWAGNDSQNRAITGVGFQPDLVWLKSRNHAYWHQLHDAVRGTSSGVLYMNQNHAEDDDYGLASFNSDGFTVMKDANNDAQNDNGKTYVAWNWKAGGSSSTNNDGAQASTVSVNTTAGFSIIQGEGTGSSTTYGHGLGVVPKVYIVKLISGTGDWYLQTSALDGGWDYIQLNATAASASMSATAPTSSVISNSATNGEDFIIYAFSEVEGFSKFGSYYGNGSADGPYIYTGFRPAFVITKPHGSTGSWQMFDVERSAYNEMDERLRADTSGAEDTNLPRDFLSNGFKIRTNNATINGSGVGMMYLAFAETPFKYANAR